jgi:predicted amidophosphoribosyltransferase
MADAAGRGALVVVLDDILTTGATLSSAAGRLRSAGIAVPVAVVLAATRRRTGPRPPVG